MAGVGGVGRALIRDAVTTLYRFSVMLDEKLFFCLQEAVSAPPLGYHHLLWPFDISQIRVLVHTSQNALCLTFLETEVT